MKYIVVAIYCKYFKIFDSHARDLYGRSHPQGSCVTYFKRKHTNDMFKVKGVKICEVQNSITCQNIANKIN